MPPERPAIVLPSSSSHAPSPTPGTGRPPRRGGTWPAKAGTVEGEVAAGEGAGQEHRM
jgi:hypothetical protein